MGKVANLYGCLSPVRIYNVQLKRHVYVPCRKCEFCTSVRHIDLKNRVEREHDRVCKNRGCAWFITLTYDNNHVPFYSSERQGLPWYSNRQDYSLSDEDILHPVIKDTDVDKYPPIVGFPDDKRAFAHIHIPDVQLYIKKVRSHIDYYCKVENKNKSDYEFRYFVCAEYGPISFRPHYHVIVWFEGGREGSSLLLEKLASLWSLGSCNIKAVTYGTVGNYVAGYVTSSVNCVSVLQRKSIRARCTFSKSPSLGALQVGTEEIWKVLSTGAFDRVKWDDTDKCFVNDVPSPAVFRRYFPKCQGFSIKSYIAKLRVYRYVYDYCKRRKIVHNVDNIDGLRLRDIEFKNPPRIAFNSLTGEILNELSPNEEKEKSWKYTDKYASLICYKYCVLYSLTPEQVLEMFERIYQNCSSVKFLKFYEYQDKLARSNPELLCYTINMDLDFLAELPEDLENCTLNHLCVFESYYIDVGKLYPNGRKCQDYVRRLHYSNDPNFVYHKDHYIDECQNRDKSKRQNDERKLRYIDKVRYKLKSN